jgi:hypothetical protein
MRIDEVIAGGIRLALRKPWLLLVPIVKYIALAMLFSAFLVIIVVSGILTSFSVPLMAAVVAFLAAVSFSASVIVSAYFDAGLFGLVCDVCDGKGASEDAFLGWGALKWADLFQVKAALYTAYILALLLFAPVALLIVWHHWTAAAALCLAALGVAFAFMAAANILFFPLGYITVLEEGGLFGYFRKSAEYVGKHLPETLLLWTTMMLAAALLSSAASVITGPIQIVPYVGLPISLMLSVFFLLLNSAAAATATAAWWIILLKGAEPSKA